jgi:hypothetical protein
MKWPSNATPKIIFALCCFTVGLIVLQNKILFHPVRESKLHFRFQKDIPMTNYLLLYNRKCNSFFSYQLLGILYQINFENLKLESCWLVLLLFAPTLKDCAELWGMKWDVSHCSYVRIKFNENRSVFSKYTSDTHTHIVIIRWISRTQVTLSCNCFMYTCF